MSKKVKIIIVVAIVLVAAGLSYYFLVYKKKPETIPAKAPAPEAKTSVSDNKTDTTKPEVKTEATK